MNVRLARLAFLAALLAAGAASAQSDQEALELADKAPVEAEQARAWRIFVEAAVREAAQRAGEGVPGARASIDLRFDRSFASGWRAVLADRLDATRVDDPSRGDHVNTLKEAYLSWQPRPDRIGDAGRINARQGVALGYNPTDFFKSNAVRSVVSVDPASLRENRMGTVMARAQQLWEQGSVTALIAPKLAGEPSASAFSPDLGATNARRRWMVAASRRLAGDWSPQWLASGAQGEPVQLGVNSTALLNQATVGYLEWSGGRSASLATQALGGAEDTRLRSRASAGLTYTTSFKLSLSAEVQHNGAGLGRDAWQALARSPAAYARYRERVAAEQELPTKDNLFLYATWQDALRVHFDVSALQRRDRVDGSRLSWLELRYRWPRTDAALQWQRNSGPAFSNFGALPERRVVQGVLRRYF